MHHRLVLAFALGALFGCGSDAPTSAPPASDDSGVADADGALGAADAIDSAIDKSATCASEFGTTLTNSFGRADGTVTAIVGPTVTTCAWPNDDHVVLQMKMNGAIYRAVDPWSEGWHPGVALDYASMLGVHAGPSGFVPYEMLPLSKEIESAIDLGTKVSVYAWSSGGASAHKIHRNGTNTDGAIVLDPGGGRPRWLLFHFADQTF
ncbi:MAG: hypothetical protein HYV09_16495 [Deltaproteobacteria bacterium]|nr:hypothetical protein [Deltaproteobacteria bacterium]